MPSFSILGAYLVGKMNCRKCRILKESLKWREKFTDMLLDELRKQDDRVCDTRGVCGEYSCLGQRPNPKNRVDRYVGLDRKCRNKCWCGVCHTSDAKFEQVKP